MLFAETYPETAAVAAELSLLKPNLKAVTTTSNIGILRNSDGNMNEQQLSELGLMSPHARVELFYSSGVFRNLLSWFIESSRQHLGPKFLIQGYAGKLYNGSDVSMLHFDEPLDTRITAAFTDEESFGDESKNPSTLLYTGAEPIGNMDSKPMEVALRRFGRAAFTQADMGQLALFGPNQYHGEPVLEPGTTRLLLIATLYNEAMMRQFPDPVAA